MIFWLIKHLITWTISLLLILFFNSINITLAYHTAAPNNFDLTPQAHSATNTDGVYIWNTDSVDWRTDIWQFR